MVGLYNNMYISSLCEERDLSDLSTEYGGARDIQFDIVDRYQM